MPAWGILAGVTVVVLLVVGPLVLRPLTPQPTPYSRPTDSLDYVPKPVRPTVVFIGDSFTGGSDMGGNGEDNWTMIASKKLEWYGCKFGVGGSGWIQGPNGWTYGARIDWALSMNPSLIVFSNGINDVKSPATQIGSAAAESLTYLRAKDPDVPVLIVGPIPLRDFEALRVMNAGVAAAAAQHSALYVDAVADGWFTGPDYAFVGSDGFHPTDPGHVYLADKFIENVSEAGVRLEKVSRDERVLCSPPNASAVRADGTPVE